MVGFRVLYGAAIYRIGFLTVARRLARFPPPTLYPPAPVSTPNAPVPCAPACGGEVSPGCNSASRGIDSAQLLRAAIGTAELAPGDKVPSEHELGPGLTALLRLGSAAAGW